MSPHQTAIEMPLNGERQWQPIATFKAYKDRGMQEGSKVLVCPVGKGPVQCLCVLPAEYDYDLKDHEETYYKAWLFSHWMPMPADQGSQRDVEFTSAIQAASNAEMTRRRERFAALEAALRKAKERIEYIHDELAEPHALGAMVQECLDASLEMDAALAGGTAALDAVVAEATAKLTEERDALAKRNDELESALADNQQMHCYYCNTVVKRDGRIQEEFDTEWQSHIADCAARPEAKLMSFICWLIAENDITNTLGERFPGVYDKAKEQLERRDARIRAEGAAAELDRLAVMETERPMCEESRHHITEYKMRAHYLRTVAAQAGEDSNGAAV